jgi:hypothetical protein
MSLAMIKSRDDWAYSLLLFLFCLLYLMKQTLWGADAGWILIVQSIIIVTIFLNKERFSFCVCKVLSCFQKPLTWYCLGSICFSMAFFQSFFLVKAVTIKIFIVVLFLPLYIQRPKFVFINMADAFALGVLIIIFLSQIGVFPNNFSETIWWTKNYAGFTNPNLPSFFLFSSLFVYFLTAQKNKFFLLFFLILFIYIYFNIVSRTFIVCSSLLVFFFLCPSFFFFLWVRLLALMAFLGLLISLGLIFGSNYIDALKNTKFGGTLNILLSYRLDQFQSAWGSFLLPPVNLHPVDSIYWELLVLFGPVFFFFFLSEVWFLVKSSYSIPVTRAHYAFLVVMIGGLSEGILMKFSPILFFLAHRMLCLSRRRK